MLALPQGRSERSRSDGDLRGTAVDSSQGQPKKPVMHDPTTSPVNILLVDEQAGRKKMYL